MRNILIIAACAALVIVTGALALFGGEMFGESGDEPRQSASGAIDDERSGRRDSREADRAARAGSPLSPTGSDAKAAAGANLPAELAEAARQINAGGPIRLDEMTMMTAASSTGNRITYRVEFSRALTSRQISSLRELAASSNRSVLCAREETREMIEMGGEIEYAYFDPTGRRLFSTPVTGC